MPGVAGPGPSVDGVVRGRWIHSARRAVTSEETDRTHETAEASQVSRLELIEVDVPCQRLLIRGGLVAPSPWKLTAEPPLHIPPRLPVGAVPSCSSREPEVLHAMHAGQEEHLVFGMQQGHRGSEREVETGDERRYSGCDPFRAAIFLVAQYQNTAHIALASNELEAPQQSATPLVARIPLMNVLPASHGGPGHSNAQVVSEPRKKHGYGVDFAVPLHERRRA